MDKFYTPVGSSQYALHFSSEGFTSIRSLAQANGDRSIESMIRLVALSVHRDGNPSFKDGDYSAHDLSVTKLVGIADQVHANLLRIADMNAIPRECIGDMLTNYLVSQ
jgi:hypothetical protein